MGNRSPEPRCYGPVYLSLSAVAAVEEVCQSLEPHEAEELRAEGGL